ncbi:DNA-3-methyladenine glycosylase [Clostridium swellfunianum]|uniref:DNA-3-methyladenine glycosylase family protein n=1 Tax=Clostridium swellfunianum TaxID=1367462 RepID=UPI00202EBC8D|nr:DNA-3-methyladenine glycosylase [Clostridium swellfunianum]MCM0649068.1 DNA-3-methyladenine glycosylase [Clostridium swellfunianum]
MIIFEYGEKEINYLKKKDKRLAEAIDRIGRIEREVMPDLFTSLIRSIVAQQISSKAASTVWNRIMERFGEVTPERLAKVSIEEIQQCGISTRKAGYIKGITEAVISRELNLEELFELPDDEVCKRLSSLNGIGVWTAEMLMIFSMQRPNIVSWGDLAIRRGMMMLYHHKELTKERFEKYRKRYSPYGSVASLYLWAISAEK